VLVSHAHRSVVALFIICLAAPLIAAIDAGKAAGTMSVDASTTALSHAAQSTAENLFDSSKRDTLVVLSDRPLGETAADDDIGLSLRARKGDLAVLMLRFDGSKLVNVRVMYKGISGEIILPGAWFQYTAAGKTAGTLKLAKREWDGHSYATSVEFSAAATAPPPKPKATPPEPAPVARPAAPVVKPAPPVSAATESKEAKPPTALLVEAMMRKNGPLALELIKRGADPNGRDQYGTPVLNWAVMTCQPEVVSALVKAKASLTYERAPGMTILVEAGACPEAEKILRAAGAR
jgi:hypothetical protein